MRVKVLKIISTCCSFVYYFTDNIVFLASVDFVSPKVPYAKNLKWKQIKNSFSLIKTVLEVIISFSQLRSNKSETANLFNILQQYDNEVLKFKSKANVVWQQIFSLRHEAKVERIWASINIMRMIMLLSKLKIVGHEYLNPIFVSLCGVCQAAANVFKVINEKNN